MHPSISLKYEKFKSNIFNSIAISTVEIYLLNRMATMVSIAIIKNEKNDETKNAKIWLPSSSLTILKWIIFFSFDFNQPKRLNFTSVLFQQKEYTLWLDPPFS